MKTAPFLIVAFTALAALAAGVLLAAQDQALFDVKQTTFVLMPDEAASPSIGESALSRAAERARHP